MDHGGLYREYSGVNLGCPPKGPHKEIYSVVSARYLSNGFERLSLGDSTSHVLASMFESTVHTRVTGNFMRRVLTC